MTLVDGGSMKLVYLTPTSDQHIMSPYNVNNFYVMHSLNLGTWEQRNHQAHCIATFPFTIKIQFQQNAVT